MRKLGIVLFLVGCGDPRAPFVGSYKGTATETIFYSDATDVRPGNATFTVSALDKSDRLQLSGRCMFTAKVVDADTIQFDPIACPPERATTNGGAMATFTDTFASGTGKLTNKTLVLTQNGERIGTDYTDGTRGLDVLFRLNVTATQE